MPLEAAANFLNIDYFFKGSTPVGSLRRSISQASQLSDLSQTSSKFSRSAGNLAGYNGYMGEMSSARSAPSIAKPYGGEQPRYYDVSHYKSEGEMGKYQTDGGTADQKDVLLQRNENEGFGFVILSTSNRIGSTIGEHNDLFFICTRCNDVNGTLSQSESYDL